MQDPNPYTKKINHYNCSIFGCFPAETDIKACNVSSVPQKQRERTLISKDKEELSDDTTP
jgi:hypothetical protein